jgi:hypothetical protein
MLTPVLPFERRIAALTSSNNCGHQCAPATATLRVWDLPKRCLRNEDSQPKAYLIENRAKRWGHIRGRSGSPRQDLR